MIVEHIVPLGVRDDGDLPVVVVPIRRLSPGGSVLDFAVKQEAFLCIFVASDNGDLGRRAPAGLVLHAAGEAVVGGGRIRVRVVLEMRRGALKRIRGAALPAP